MGFSVSQSQLTFQFSSVHLIATLVCDLVFNFPLEAGKYLNGLSVSLSVCPCVAENYEGEKGGTVPLARV